MFIKERFETILKDIGLKSKKICKHDFKEIKSSFSLFNNICLYINFGISRELLSKINADKNCQP